MSASEGATTFQRERFRGCASLGLAKLPGMVVGRTRNGSARRARGDSAMRVLGRRLQKKAAWHRRAMSRVPWCSTFCACVWGCSHGTHRWSYTQVHTPLQCSCACEWQCGGCALGRSSSGFAVLAVLRAFARLAPAQSQLRAVFSFLDGYSSAVCPNSTQGVRHPDSPFRHGP